MNKISKSHIFYLIYNNMKWIKEKCLEESLKYQYKKDFYTNNKSAYNSASKNGWLDEICSHMMYKFKSKEYWTKEICQEESLKYKTRTEFYRKSPNIYRKSLKNGWLDEICSHMCIIGNRIKRCVYVYEFDDDYVYIGLTYNTNKRNLNHMKSGQVFKHMEETKKIPIFIKLTDYIDVEDAKKLEGYYVEKYRKDGFNILNIIKTGGIGGNVIKWTKEKCLEESLKYNSRSSFAKNSASAYSSANKHKWLDEICEHMRKLQD